VVSYYSGFDGLFQHNRGKARNSGKKRLLFIICLKKSDSRVMLLAFTNS
jgi:hypothetical protein